MKLSLIGKVALVTGAGSGIGRSCSLALAGSGARVACADIEASSADGTARLINSASESEGAGHAFETDVARESDVRRLVAATLSHFGRLDIAFCNAGIAPAEAAFPGGGLDQWERVLAVNLTGAWLTARESARVMLEQGAGGRIIFTASVYGLVGGFEPNSGAYQAAKGGIVNLTRSLAVLLGSDQITVNAMAPGFVRSNLGRARLRHPQDAEGMAFEREIVARTPLRRIGEPDDLTGLAVFLASDLSSYITGAIIPVDGGWLAL